MHWARVAFIVAIVGTTFVAPLGIASRAQTANETRALERLFAERVDNYVALHRHLELLVPPEIVTSDVDALFAPRAALAREMRQARHDARQGEIFTAALETHFRTLVEGALRREGICDMLAIIEDENSVHTPARVNGDYPAGRSVPCIPPSVLAALPTLPSELRYSFVGRDLVLWDVHAGLIVDFVPHAVPRAPIH
jgi:hypothetical protein